MSQIPTEKLQMLKQSYLNQDDQDMIRHKEERLRELETLGEIAEQKPIQDFVEYAKDRVRGINILLKYGDRTPGEESRFIEEETLLTKAERLALMHERRVWNDIVTRFDENFVQSQVDNIHKWVDSKIRKLG